MNSIQRAQGILVDAEAELKRLIGEAANEGDYLSLEILIRWASSLGAMHAQELLPASQSEPLRVVDNDAGYETSNAQGFDTTPAKSARSKRRVYPIFAKSGSVLVKTGWSKSSKSEYQHKAPQFVVKRLTEALSRHAKKGTVVSMDKILPLKMDDGNDIPDYQVYLSLAWLRQIQVVIQNGRKGYAIRKPADFLQKIDRAWSELGEAVSC